MLVIPPKLNSLFVSDLNLPYEWEEKIGADYYFTYLNEKLSESIWDLNHKSTVGLAIALSEWTLWRLKIASGQDFTWEMSILEAMWAGLIDKNYIKEWDYDGDIESDKIKGPLWVILNCMNDVRYNYIEGDIFINAKISTLAAITRLVTTDKKAFDDWLTDCIRRSMVLFPAEYDRAECNDPNEYYDSSHELPIPRAFFFEPDFDYSTADIDTLLANFISSLDYKNNEFLNSPEVMIEKGYVGIPYQYKGK